MVKYSALFDVARFDSSYFNVILRELNSTYSILSDSTNSLSSSAYILVIGEEDSLSANYYVLTTNSNTLNSDYVIVVVESDTLTSDSCVSREVANSLDSDYVVDTRRYDDFEDGDYTSSPNWSVVSGSWEVVSARPYEGTYSLRANSASYTSNYLEHTKLNSETITDSTWSVKTYSESGSAESGYILYDSNNNYISLGLTTTQSPYISDSNGFDNASIADIQDQWLTFQVTFNTGTGNYTVEILNSSGSSVFSRTRTNPLNNVKRVRLYTYYRGSEYTYFDNVTYGFEYVDTYEQLDSDSYIQNSFTATIESDSFIKQSLSNVLYSDYSIITSVSESINSLSYINASDSNSLSATYFVSVLGEEGSLTSDYYISSIYDSVITSDYSLSNTESNTISSSYSVLAHQPQTIVSNYYIGDINPDLFIEYVFLLYSDSNIKRLESNSLYSDTFIIGATSYNLSSDYYVLVLGEEGSLSSHYSIIAAYDSSLTSDSYITTYSTNTVNSDYFVVIPTKSVFVSSDYHIAAGTSVETLDSDSYAQRSTLIRYTGENRATLSSAGSFKFTPHTTVTIKSISLYCRGDDVVDSNVTLTLNGVESESVNVGAESDEFKLFKFVFSNPVAVSNTEHVVTINTTGSAIIMLGGVDNTGWSVSL